jgi:hypothetical protein
MKYLIYLSRVEQVMTHKKTLAVNNIITLLSSPITPVFLPFIKMKIKHPVEMTAV